MRAEKWIYAALKADSGIAAQVGSGNASRIYATILPQNPTMPAITTHKISATRIPPIHAGPGESLVDARMQVTCHAKQYSDVKALMEVVRAALDRSSGTFNGVLAVSCLLDLEGPDGFDPDNGIFYQPLDFMIRHYE